MKIIAFTNPSERSWNKEYLVQISDDELQRLVGFQKTVKFEIGDVIHVGEIFNRLRHMSENRSVVNSAIKNLRALADMMESIEPAVLRAIEAPRSNEEESEVST